MLSDRGYLNRHTNLELKAVEHVKGIDKAQLLTYMRLSGIATGLLINFHEQKLADGVQRFKL